MDPPKLSYDLTVLSMGWTLLYCSSSGRPASPSSWCSTSIAQTCATQGQTKPIVMAASVDFKCIAVPPKMYYRYHRCAVAAPTPAPPKPPKMAPVPAPRPVTEPRAAPPPAPSRPPVAARVPMLCPHAVNDSVRAVAISIRNMSPVDPIVGGTHDINKGVTDR